MFRTGFLCKIFNATLLTNQKLDLVICLALSASILYSEPGYLVYWSLLGILCVWGGVCMLYISMYWGCSHCETVLFTRQFPQVIFHPTTNVEQNLVAEAINVIGAISSHLSWSNYYFIITHYLRQLPKQIEIQRSLVK